MFIVLASRYDEVSRGLVSSVGDGLQLLTSEDLSARGWQYHPDGDRSVAVIGGRLVKSGEIRGVLTRLPCVDAQELCQTVPHDRPYMAAEMTAFLAAWLSGLSCPVLNRPTPACLMGPYWRQERWVLAAAALGIRVRPVRRVAGPLAIESSSDVLARSTSVTVVGSRCVGQADESLLNAARSLADVAGVDLLCVRFASGDQGASLLSADYWIDLANQEVSDAVWEYFEEHSGR